MHSTASEHMTDIEFHDIYMVGNSSRLASGFSPKLTDELDELHVESLEFIDRSELYKGEEEVRRLLRVFVSFGARWTLEEAPGEPGDEIDDSKLGSDRILATIEGDFVVEYFVSEEITQDYIDEYALKNSVSHAFPYWREYLIGQCTKLRMNDARLPQRVVAPFGLMKD